MLLFGGLKRPWNTGIILPATRELHVDNRTPPVIRRFFQLDSCFGKGSKIRHETLKPLEKTGLFRFVEIIPQGHTAGSMLVNQGHTIKQVQEFLSHEKASTTLDIYTHVSMEGKKDTAQVMDQLLA